MSRQSNHLKEQRWRAELAKPIFGRVRPPVEPPRNIFGVVEPASFTEVEPIFGTVQSPHVPSVFGDPPSSSHQHPVGTRPTRRRARSMYEPSNQMQYTDDFADLEMFDKSGRTNGWEDDYQYPPSRSSVPSSDDKYRHQVNQPPPPDEHVYGHERERVYGRYTDGRRRGPGRRN
jgi:hypothetical protein